MRAARPGTQPVKVDGTRPAPKRTALRIGLGDETRTLNWADLGPQDDIICRRATGMPVSSFFENEHFGADTLLVIWWMAGRKAGKRESFKQILDTYSSFDSMEDFTIEADEESDDVIDAEVVDPDPLPSGDE